MDMNDQKKATLDDLTASIDNLAALTAKGFERVENRMDKLDGRMDKLESSLEGLRADVNNYLQLSDKRYMELKAKQNVIVNWVKQIADKTGVKINLEDLDKAA